MSPEQIVGRKPDPRSDIFSLGSLFYELLTGTKPFEAPTLPEVFDRILLAEPAPLRDLTPMVQDELSRILSKMMQKRIEDRYASVDELLHDVMRFGRNLQRQKSELRHEVEGKARNLRNALAERPAATVEEGDSTARLLSTVERDDLSFMALVGLRDGIDIELWRLQRGIEPPSLRASRMEEEKAEAAFQDALARFNSGDLAACLVRVSEALRLAPHHGGAGELSERVREAVVERASYFDNESEADLDVLVAAFLAFDKGESPRGDTRDLSGRTREIKTSLSELLLSEPPQQSENS
jgi:hypothetical protein